MTKHEIIDLIANTYNLGNRATNEKGGCNYLNSEGKMCAVGMTLTDLAQCERYSLAECENSAVEDVFEEEEILWDAQKEQFRGHYIGFWRRIQALHDQSNLWDDNGLSVEGLLYIKNLNRFQNY